MHNVIIEVPMQYIMPAVDPEPGTLRVDEASEGACDFSYALYRQQNSNMLVYVIPWFAVQFGINCTSNAFRKVINCTRRS